MSITKYIDEKLIVSLLIVSVIVFFLQKYLTKKYTHPTTGEVSHYVNFGGKMV